MNLGARSSLLNALEISEVRRYRGSPMRTIPHSIGVIALIRDLWYTTCEMEGEAPAAAHRPIFLALHQEARAHLLPAELDILEGMSGADALVDKADGGLDGFAGRVARAVDDVAEVKTRKKLKTNLFKGLPLSKFRRPVLGGQLLAQTAWASALHASGIATLVALANEAPPLVAQGEEAAKARITAAQKNREFRDVGARKQFIDRVNAARELAHGDLSRAPFVNPTLPSDYADRFWLGEPPADEEESIDDVKAAITGLKAKLEAREAQLAKMEAEAALAAQSEAEQQGKLKDLEALEARRAELTKQIAELHDELKK